MFTTVNMALNPNVGATYANLPCTTKVDWVRVWQFGNSAVSSHTGSIAPETAPVFTNGMIRITNGQSAELMDLSGRILLAHKGNWAKSITGLGKGVYILKVSQGPGVRSCRLICRP